jgi:hypothetical protein
MHDVVIVQELGGTAAVAITGVKDAGFCEELGDGLATALVPKFIEPAVEKALVLFGSGFGGSGHERCLVRGQAASIQEIVEERGKEIKRMGDELGD